MKKFIMALVCLMTMVLSVNAQIIRTEELENYAKEKYGSKWVEAAENIASQVSLDKNNALTYTQVVEAQGKTKEQLYVLINYWYTNTFNSGKAVIQLNDKDAGVIIGKGFLEGVAIHSGGVNSYKVNICPIIKTDIKDGKIRITYTVPFYNVDKLAGGGIMSAFGGGNRKVEHIEENWVLDKSFPFAKKDRHKKTSSKALVMAHAYSNVIMDKIEEAVKNGMVGNETDEW